MRWKLFEQLLQIAGIMQILHELNIFLTLQVFNCNILKYFCPHIAFKRRVNTIHLIMALKIKALHIQYIILGDVWMDVSTLTTQSCT